jgi:phosphatidylethanolamine-binding protein (PEBP) family uncharacterized protein
MVLSTPAFSDGGVIPNKHTQVQQAERGISPALNWVNAPPATQSFVVHMRDPEVARNRTTDDQVHWLVWNIPGTEKGLSEGMPEGAQLPNGIRQISASGAVSRSRGAGQRPDAPRSGVRSTRSTWRPAPMRGKRAVTSSRSWTAM